MLGANLTWWVITNHSLLLRATVANGSGKSLSFLANRIVRPVGLGSLFIDSEHVLFIRVLWIFIE